MLIEMKMFLRINYNGRVSPQAMIIRILRRLFMTDIYTFQIMVVIRELKKNSRVYGKVLQFLILGNIKLLSPRMDKYIFLILTGLNGHLMNLFASGVM